MGKDRFLVLNWDDLFWDVYELAKMIKRSGYKADLLVVIARGGWVVGRILSDLLELRNVAGITIKSYKGIGVKKTPKIVQGIEHSLKDKKILLVDDIVDSGDTLMTALKYLREKEPADVRTAIPYVKPKAVVRPDYYIKVVDRWVVFPYEYKETISLLHPQDNELEIANPEITKALMEIENS